MNSLHKSRSASNAFAGMSLNNISSTVCVIGFDGMVSYSNDQRWRSSGMGASLGFSNWNISSFWMYAMRNQNRK